MSTSMGSAMPMFSYAQAAKGLAPAKEEGSESSSHKPTNTGSVTPDGPSRSPRSKSRHEEKDGSESTIVEAITESAVMKDVSEKLDSSQTLHSQQPSENGQASNHADSPDLTVQNTSSKDGDFSPKQNGRADSWEKGSQTSTSADQATQTTEKDKSKDVDDDWEKVSVPSVSAEKELKAAPLPTVNIWQQRREAQQAKQRELGTQRSSVPTSATTSPQPKPVTDDSRRKQNGKEVSEKESPPATRRPHDRKEVSAPTTSRPTSQNSEKLDAANLPSVADTKSWPTPEIAIVDERRKSTTYERNEKPETKGNGTKGHGNKWVHVPFVPTAKFETPLPTAATRRGGRTGPRGRDGQGRGSHANAVEKHDAPGSMGPPPLPKQTTENDRGRKSDSIRGGRASSVPTVGSVPSNSDSNTASFRKPSAPVGKEQSVAEGLTAVSRTLHESGSGDHASGNDVTSQAFSTQDDSTASIKVNGELSSSQVATQEPSVETPQGPNPESTSRQSYQSDRSKINNSNFVRPNGDMARERGPQRNREWSREKSDAAREKVESWRDREITGDASSRREPRPDRGRGSTYRGNRGNHSHSTFSASHPYTAPLLQNGFENSKPNVSNDSRSRQTSQPYTAQNQSNSNRATPRSQSIAVGMMYPGYYNPQSMPQAISPLSPEMSGFGYPQQMHMQPGIMNAMPYHDPLNSYALLSMVMTQVEYYFSIDNLCKDLFLRRHMDSQGFVPLSVIADFKRIKTLTDNNGTLDALRWVCPQLKTIEFVRTAENEEKLRRRDGWQDFVLPMEDRDASAKIEGPTILPQPTQRVHSMQHFSTENAPYFGSHIRSPPADMSMSNGIFPATSPSGFVPMASGDGQMEERSFNLPPGVTQGQLRRESLTSPVSQDMAALRSSSHGQNYRPTGGMVNGHHRQSSRGMLDENVFPDEQISNINIFMRDSSRDATGEAAAPAPGISRVFSNESTNSHGSRTDGPRVSGLRGSAASPEQLARLQGMTFGTSESQTSTSSEPPVFFTKDGQQTQMPPLQPGHFYHTYQSLHDTAMQQREHGVEGALEPMFLFWTNFLIDKFNARMYKEFKLLATEDVNRKSENGFHHLLNYYQNVLKSGLAMPEIVAADLVELLHHENDENNTIFKMLRKAWRDGALNLKSRKRIGDLLNDQEKLRFDK